MKGQDNVEANVLSRLPMDQQSHEIMLNHPPMDLRNPLLNKNPLDLKYIQEFQVKDTTLQRALKEDKK